MTRRHALSAVLAALLVGGLEAPPSRAGALPGFSEPEITTLGQYLDVLTKTRSPEERGIASCGCGGARLADVDVGELLWREAVATGGSVSALVRLPVEFAPGALADPAGRAAERIAIAEAGAALESELMRHGEVTVVRRYENLPYLSILADADVLLAVREDPRGLKLMTNPAFHPTLASSVPVTRSDAVQAWGFTGLGHAVAVLDTGVDTGHNFFAGRTVAEACYSTTNAGTNLSSTCPGGVSSSTATGSGAACDFTGCDHGTHVAGIALQDGFDDGMAPAASLIAMQVFSEEADVADCAPRPAPCPKAVRDDWLAGLDRVVTLSSTIEIASVNLSLGGGQYCSPCQGILDFWPVADAFEALNAVGVSVVASAGNDGCNDALGAPACVLPAISVGSTTDADDVSSFSNSNTWLTLFAPGSDIDAASEGTTTGTTTKSGTSMAAPHVAGAIAQMRHADPGATVTEIRDTLASLSDGAAIDLPGYPGSHRPRLRTDCAVEDLIGTDTPTGVTATDGVFTTKIQIDWDPDFRVFRWDVYVSETDDVLTRQFVDFTLTPGFSYFAPEPGTTYYFWIQARICNELSDFSASESGVQAVPTVALVDASDGLFEDRVRVTWTAVSPQPDFYEIWREQEGARGAPTEIDFVSGTTTTYDDTGAGYYTYDYYVRAVYGPDPENLGPLGTGNSGYRLLPAPTNVTASNGTYDDRVQLFWNTVVGPGTRYSIERSTGGSFVQVASNVANNVWNDTAVSPGVVYTYRMRATLDGLTSGYSLTDDGWLEVVMFPTLATGLPGTRSGSIDAGDFDRDGDMDLAIAGTVAGDGKLTGIFRQTAGRGTGLSFTELVVPLPTVDHARWADADGDGWLDLFAGGYTGSSLETAVWGNAAGTAFTDLDEGIPNQINPRADWGDFDNDGDPDLAIAGYSGTGAVRIFRNDGVGGMTLHQQLDLVIGGALEWGDADDDGDLDLVFSASDDSQPTGDQPPITRLYRNDGGTFVDAMASLPDVDLGCLGWGDFDKDGDEDLALAGYDTSNERSFEVYRNDGGSFTLFATLTGLTACGLGWGDFDLDGDLDLVAAGSTDAGGRTLVYRNDIASFVDLTEDADLPPRTSAAVEWADLDGDGALDLLVSGLDPEAAGTVVDLTVHRNGSPGSNHVPTAPTNLGATPGPEGMVLSWDAALDAESFSNGLSYNLRVGTAPGLSDVVDPLASPTGQRLVAKPGNARQVTSWELKGLAGGTYYWSVQAIDASFAGGPFAAEGSFTFGIFSDGFESGDTSAWE